MANTKPTFPFYKTGILSLFLIFIAALNTEVTLATPSDTTALTKQKVKDWIQTRIKTNTMQNKLKANADKYEDVVKVFHEQRKVILEKNGWTVPQFEATAERIMAAVNAMEMAEEQASGKEEHEKQIREIQDNQYISQEQKKEMIKALNAIREQEETAYITPTKPDWPAVKPYLKEIEQLTDWIAGNIPNPPRIE